MTEMTPDAPVYHAHTSAQTLDRLTTSVHGLSRTEVAQRQAQYGANLLPDAPKRHCNRMDSAWP